MGSGRQGSWNQEPAIEKLRIIVAVHPLRIQGSNIKGASRKWGLMTDRSLRLIALSTFFLGHN